MPSAFRVMDLVFVEVDLLQFWLSKVGKKSIDWEHGKD